MGINVIKRHKKKEAVLDDGTFRIAHRFHCYAVNIETVYVYWPCLNKSFDNFFPFNFLSPLWFHSQLDKNHISCIEDGAFRALRGLEVL